jgi:hypothetical protein
MKAHNFISMKYTVSLFRVKVKVKFTLDGPQRPRGGVEE